MKLTRRNMMKASAGALLGAGVWPGSLAASDGNTEAFTFVQINDLHYMDAKCSPWFEKVFKAVKENKPDFVLVVGDLVDGGTDKELGGIKDLLKTIGVATYTVPGNHDYKTQTDRKAYDELFPEKLNYHFAHKGWQFVALDTTDGIKYQNVSAGKTTLDWIDAQLPKWDTKQPTVVFTHFPLGEGVNMRLANADGLLEKFKPLNLKAVYGGHYHAYTEKKANNTVITTNRCCSFRKNNHDKTTEKGFFVVKAKDGTLTRTFVEVKPL